MFAECHNLRKVPMVSGPCTPRPRSGHRMCADDNCIYIFGGFNPAFKTFNELWRFNTTTEKWSLLPDDDGLAPKSCASSSMVMLGSNLFVFGGTGYPFAKTNSNELFMYSLKMKRWFNLTDTSSLANRQDFAKHPKDFIKTKQCGCQKFYDRQPVPKYGQGMATAHQKIYIHSGTQGEEFTKELHSFSLKTFRWTEYEFCFEHTRNAPQPRYRHELASIDNRLYVLGGALLNETFNFDQLTSFNLQTRKWEQEACQSNKGSSPTTPGESRQLPVGRKAHTCVSYKNKIYMCGGYNAVEGMLDDFWSFNVNTKEWKQHKNRTFPYPVQFHSSAVTSYGCMYIHGGLTTKGNRVSDLHQLWLQVPTLTRMAWMKVVQQLRDNNQLTKETLIKLKIPRHFIGFIDDKIDVIAA
ncbi:kelch domain-containing protein 10-like isoform X5 [Clytia hemisphaerica]|uniref:Kelch domain-containing protein 10 n=2 Tax=Clytia hemisphaerica TaxID=252671 RepID=A0A7M5TPX7_9CNID